MPRTDYALEAVDLLYRAALEPALWPEALERLAHAVGCVGTVMIPITPSNTSGIVVSPSLAEPTAEYQREWWRHDTRVGRIFSRQLSRGVFCEAELFSDEELARDPLRQEFLAAHGLGAFAAQLVEPWPGHVVSLSLQRGLEHGHFEGEELEFLRWLGQHAARALTISLRLSADEGIAGGLLDLLDRYEGGVFVLNVRGEVSAVNARAERMLGDGLAISKRRLIASTPARQKALDALIASALDVAAINVEHGPVALSRPSGRKPFLVQATPLPATYALGSAPIADFGLRGVIVLVVDPEQDRRAPFEALRLLGLTAAEARLAALVGSGMRRRDAAAILGISEWTARDALKHIYSKLDIRSQGELVRLVDRIAVFEGRRNVHL